jgi:hypothetical protein
MYAGIPSVVFPYGGLEKLVQDNFNALVVRSKEEYQQAIEYLFRHPAERQRIGENAASYARQIFGAEHAARKFNAIYDYVLQFPKRQHLLGSRQGRSILDLEISYEHIRNQALQDSGSDRFIHSLAEAGGIFYLSKYETTKELSFEADRKIARSSELLRTGGVDSYLGVYDQDPFLWFWSALILHERGFPSRALEAFFQALRNGYPHWRIYWYIARLAINLDNQELRDEALEELQKKAPDFEAAKTLRASLAAAS